MSGEGYGADYDVPCSCDGCAFCKGSEPGCTCNVDWDAMTERRLDGVSGYDEADCQDFILTGRCHHSDAEHDAMADGAVIASDVAAEVTRQQRERQQQSRDDEMGLTHVIASAKGES